jgi:hypothetical protein
MTTETITAVPESVAIARPDSAAMARSADAALAMVESFEVCDAPTYDLAADELKAIKSRATALDEQRKAITKPLDEAKAAVMALFKPPLEVLTRAEGIIKTKMLGYQQEQQRIQREAQLQAEREAQAIRDEAARKAAALEAEGKAGEAAVQRQVSEMVVAAPPAVVAEAPKAAGVSVRSSVEFEVTDLLALVQHVAQHPELLALVTADSVKLRAYVKGLGTACKLPGVRVFEKASLAASRK